MTVLRTLQRADLEGGDLGVVLPGPQAFSRRQRPEGEARQRRRAAEHLGRKWLAREEPPRVEGRKAGGQARVVRPLPKDGDPRRAVAG